MDATWMKENHDKSCPCMDKKRMPEPEYSNPYSPQLELATAYIPSQKLEKIYPPIESLVKGTVFPELDKEYHERHYIKEKKYACKEAME